MALAAAMVASFTIGVRAANTGDRSRLLTGWFWAYHARAAPA